MSIRELTEDAIFMHGQGRYFGALTLVLAAVAASSRRCFDHPRKILNRPGGVKNDGEAFKAFLGGRLRSDHELPGLKEEEYGSSGIQIQFKGNMLLLEEILYSLYRCEMLHEGNLPEDVHFIKNGSAGFTIEGSNEYISMNENLILTLANAVINARCNGQEFGISHYKLRLKDGVHRQNLADHLARQPREASGRLPLFEAIISVITPKIIETASDERLQQSLSESISAGLINGGLMTGLYFRGFTTEDQKLTEEGLNMLRYLSGNYEIVDDTF